MVRGSDIKEGGKVCDTVRNVAGCVVLLTSSYCVLLAWSSRTSFFWTSGVPMCPWVDLIYHS